MSHLPLAPRFKRLPSQLLRRNPFQGDILPKRIPLLAPFSGRPTLPFPHPWNYREPLRILETFYWNADADPIPQRHNRYLDVPGFAPVLVTRDPLVIRAIATDTGDKPGQFDRDTMPTQGIARATGKDTLLYANGSEWKKQKKLSTPPFARTTLFQPEYFHDFEATFRHTVSQRLEAMDRNHPAGSPPLRIRLEDEIKAVMLEMLVNNFFGADVPYERIRNHYVPALERVIGHIVSDTVINKVGIPLHCMPGLTRGIAQTKAAQAAFEDLTNIALAQRPHARGLWKQFESDAPDDALRSNIRVFLAGALEATTSYASWALAHLARHPEAQERLYAEIKDINDYSPQTLEQAKYLGYVLNETLRLSPSLYFFPRRATADTWIETTAKQRMLIPNGTHILLDVWNANHHEDHWGVSVTGYPAKNFAPDRWEKIASGDRASQDRLLHFGFGHGPRFCPGKHLGQLEVALVVGAVVKLFRLSAVHPDNPPRAGVSTKPRDSVEVELHRRETAKTDRPG